MLFWLIVFFLTLIANLGLFEMQVDDAFFIAVIVASVVLLVKYLLSNVIEIDRDDIREQIQRRIDRLPDEPDPDMREASPLGFEQYLDHPSIWISNFSLLIERQNKVRKGTYANPDKDTAIRPIIVVQLEDHKYVTRRLPVTFEITTMNDDLIYSCKFISEELSFGETSIYPIDKSFSIDSRFRTQDLKVRIWLSSREWAERIIHLTRDTMESIGREIVSGDMEIRKGSLERAKRITDEEIDQLLD